MSGSSGVVWARKSVVLTAGLVAHAVVAVVTQVPWTVDAGVGPAGAVTLTGAQVAPGVLAMALAGLAAGAFGAFTQGVWARCAGGLVCATGAGVAVLAGVAVAGGAVAGVAGWVAVAGGVVACVAGGVGACVAGRWGRASSRFSSPAGVDAGGGRGGGDAVSDWDALSRGEDPTV
ncbi:Tryptophan-associated transmembrane protein (Trp_oprn_chp) [Dermatophilus congolensis]|uniref:Tryptophan-associated transmembrane protein (Trp_oprn_chp) n=1 Tax=Dermatophilus congolensis TaxID=1863 RepID=A0AA46H0G6_9MICO|nr:Tryptophan-associated transmembrane protein (Trp_oprn_chp) [Dermatophilus congolensis]